MNDNGLNEISDLEKVRSQRRLVNTLNNLVEEARNGTLTCAAVRVYYKDGSSEVKMIGGTPQEQAEVLAKLEAMEAKGKALMEELRPVLDEVFAHMPENERGQILDSPERIRLALNTLSDDEPVKLSPLTQEQLTRYKTFLEELLLPCTNRKQDN